MVHGMSAIKSMEPLELLLLVACWWHISLIQGNLAIAYYSKTAMPSDLRDGKPKNNLWHLILYTGEAILINAAVIETMKFFNLFINDEKHSENQYDDTRNSWEIFKSKSLNANNINFDNGKFREVCLSHFI